MMTDDELNEIEARAAVATAGPWVMAAFAVQDREMKLLMGFKAPGQWEWGGWVRCRNEANAEFIAHARTDVPALVAELRRLRALSPAWHDRPTGPGLWVRKDGKGNWQVAEYDADDIAFINEHPKLYTGGRVFGPMPADEGAQA